MSTGKLQPVYQGPARPAEHEQPHANYIKDVLDVVFRRKILILVFFFTTILTAVIGVIFFQKVQYEAYSRILIEPNRGYVSERTLPTGGNKRDDSGFSLEQQIGLALDILNDKEVTYRAVENVGPRVIYPRLGEPGLFKQVLQSLGLAKKSHDKISEKELASQKLQNDLIITRTDDRSSIIYVGFRHKNPEIAAQTVNSVINAYIDLHLRLGKKPQLTTFFDEQFIAKKAALEQAERNFKTFKDGHGLTSSPDDGISFLLKQSKKDQVELNDSTSREAELKKQLGLVRGHLSHTEKNPEAIKALQEKLVELQVKESELSTRYRDDSRTMRNIRDEIGIARQKLRELGFNGRADPTALNSSSETYKDLQDKLLQNELEVNALRARREVIRKQMDSYNAEVKRLDDLKPEYQSLNEELSLARDNYRMYQTKYEEFRISDALDAKGIANINVLEKAQPPLTPIPTKTALILFLAVLFGLFGGIGIALVIQLFTGTLSKQDDVEHYLKLPVLASIPEFDPVVPDTGDGPHWQNAS
jgi:uncharacterized protein involved in exopolysaccharide biosynthesis